MGAPVCILHHHIGTETACERGLNVTSARAAYEAQIDRLCRDYDVIDLETLLNGRLPRRPLLMTFDDAFRSVLDVAREVLAPRALPAVFFVNPGLLEPGAVSLDGTIAWAANRAGLAAVCREAGVPVRESIGAVVVEEMAVFGARERTAIKERILAAFGRPDPGERAPLLLPEDLALLRGLGVEIGNHTLTHVHCRALRDDELQDEIVTAKARLEALSGGPVRAFSVPYGHERDLTPALLGVLRDSGHRAIFLVHGRANTARPAPDIWYRTSLHNEKPADLARVLRWMPMARALKHRLA
jgi:peptidoglycan/xylan/chitin deacetylase (PgdA/CDA1 family)